MLYILCPCISVPLKQPRVHQLRPRGPTDVGTFHEAVRVKIRVGVGLVTSAGHWCRYQSESFAPKVTSVGRSRAASATLLALTLSPDFILPGGPSRFPPGPSCSASRLTGSRTKFFLHQCVYIPSVYLQYHQCVFLNPARVREISLDTRPISHHNSSNYKSTHTGGNKWWQRWDISLFQEALAGECNTRVHRLSCESTTQINCTYPVR